MVERTKSEGMDRFEGTVEKVVKEEDENGKKYHVIIEPHDIEVKGKTGRMHEWVRIPPTTSENSVPEGSVIDKYLQDLELASPDVKRASSVDVAMNLMLGRKYRFVRKKLGKSFEGYDARDYWTPVVQLS